jgi:hypothetical protein
MNFIKKVFDGAADESVHLQFQKFSKGEFKDRAIIKAKKVKNKYTIYTSAEFANDLVRIGAQKLGEGTTAVTGAIISTNDLKKDIDFKEIKQFQGVKKYLIEKEMSGNELLRLIDRFPKAFFALSFNIEGYSLKIKPKAPKSGKPSSKEDEKPNADFCKLITEDASVGRSFIFEDNDFKSAVAYHIFLINQIVIPEELKGEKDFAKVRERAQRKGKIIRNITIDEQVFKEEKEFAA